MPIISIHAYVPGMELATIANTLSELATLLDLAGENQFKVKAHSNAARVIETYQSDLQTFLSSIQSGSVKGIGTNLAEKIQNLVATGSCKELEDLKATFPPGVLEMLRISGLGPKKVKALYTELKIETIEGLDAACKNGSVASLKGFGEKTASNILAGIERLKTYASKFRYDVALAAANKIIAFLNNTGLVKKIEVAGSLRRKKEIVGDIDIVCVSDDAEALQNAFVNMPEVTHVSGHGKTKSSVVLNSGIPCDLRVIDEIEFPAALQYFTGNKAHNTELRSIAQSKGLKLNEYGLWKSEQRITTSSEEDIYAHLGLHCITPELREGIEEFSRYGSEKHNQPLIEEKDLKGILHAHTTYSDGKNTLREMALAVKELGYEYFGVSDHSQSAVYARGLSIENVKRQHAEIDALNEELAPFIILKGIESDILADGELDYPDTVLESFDFIVASVHTLFTQTREQMTKRIITALQNPYTTILGHPTGRLLLERDGYALDLDAVIETAAKHKKAIEINASPYRLDIDWRFHQKAKQLGIPLPINPDAHSIAGISYVTFGVGIARKGGLGAKDVLNTMSKKQILQYFK